MVIIIKLFNEKVCISREAVSKLLERMVDKPELIIRDFDKSFREDFQNIMSAVELYQVKQDIVGKCNRLILQEFKHRFSKTKLKICLDNGPRDCGNVKTLIKVYYITNDDSIDDILLYYIDIANKTIVPIRGIRELSLNMSNIYKIANKSPEQKMRHKTQLRCVKNIYDNINQYTLKQILYTKSIKYKICGLLRFNSIKNRIKESLEKDIKLIESQIREFEDMEVKSRRAIAKYNIDVIMLNWMIGDVIIGIYDDFAYNIMGLKEYSEQYNVQINHLKSDLEYA